MNLSLYENASALRGLEQYQNIIANNIAASNVAGFKKATVSFEAIEGGEYDGGKSLLTPELKAEMQEAARNTLNESSEKISIRIAHSDLDRVKARAFREGIPYQTLIKSIIHQAVTR